MQDDLARQFILNFKGKTVRLKACEFLNFKRYVDQISLEDMILRDGIGMDLQIIHHPRANQIFVLTLCEVIAMKELLNGTMVMLELQRILDDRLVSFVI